MLEALLVNAGYRVVCARSVFMALEALAEEAFPIVIIDRGLEDGDGIVLPALAKQPVAERVHVRSYRVAVSVARMGRLLTYQGEGTRRVSRTDRGRDLVLQPARRPGDDGLERDEGHADRDRDALGLAEPVPELAEPVHSSAQSADLPVEDRPVTTLSPSTLKRTSRRLPS